MESDLRDANALKALSLQEQQGKESKQVQELREQVLPYFSIF